MLASAVDQIDDVQALSWKMGKQLKMREKKCVKHWPSRFVSLQRHPIDGGETSTRSHCEPTEFHLESAIMFKIKRAVTWCIGSSLTPKL